MDVVRQLVFNTPTPVPKRQHARNVVADTVGAARPDCWHQPSTAQPVAAVVRHANSAGTRSTGVFAVPGADDSDSDDGEGAPSRSRSVSYRVPSETDDDEDGDEAMSALRAPPGVRLGGGSGGGSTAAVRRSLRGDDAVAAVLRARTRQLQHMACATAALQQSRLQEQLAEVEAELVQQLAEVAVSMHEKQAGWAAADERSRVSGSEERDRRLRQLQAQQAASAAATQQQLQRSMAEARAKAAALREAQALRLAEEELQRRRQEQERLAAAQAAQEEAAKAAAAHAAAVQAEQAHKAQQAAQQPAGAKAEGAASAGPAPAAAEAGQPAAAAVKRAPTDLCIAAGAAEDERALAAKLAAAVAATEKLAKDPGLKPQRRQLEKRITVLVSQISGTKEQVNDKSKDLLQVLRSCPDDVSRTFACLTLATRMVSQCEGQISKLGSFAFPVAMVCARVGAEVPLFIDLLLAKLFKACILLVPKYYVYRGEKGSVSAEQHFTRLGYKKVEDGGHPDKERLETGDEFVARMSGYIQLFGALVQADEPGHVYGISHAWAYVARFLNHLPPNRTTASALVAFLLPAGYRLHAVYRGQFIKLLHCVHDCFLEGLDQGHDPDARGAATRLRTYLQTQQYLVVPEGRELKDTDLSSNKAFRA